MEKSIVSKGFRLEMEELVSYGLKFTAKLDWLKRSLRLRADDVSTISSWLNTLFSFFYPEFKS